MARFTDNRQRAWLVEINYATIKAVRARLGLDLLKLVEDRMQPLAELLRDAVRLIDVLYVVCERQCKEANVSDEDFGRALAGDALEEAADAFMQGLVAFFPKRQREALSTALAKGRKVGELVMDRALRTLDSVDPASVADQWEQRARTGPNGAPQPATSTD